MKMDPKLLQYFASTVRNLRWRYKLDEFEQEAKKITLDLFEEGKKEGFLSRDISEQTLVIYLDILKSGIAANSKLYADEESYPRIVRELNELILYGLVDTGDRPELNHK